MEQENNYQSKPEELALKSPAAECVQEEADDETDSQEGEGRKIRTTSDLRAMIPHDDQAMLDFLVAFLRKYMVCEEYQLHLLALWIVHTWTHQVDVATAAYLDVRSPEPESGKTRCLQLLKLLSQEPWFASGPSLGTVKAKLLEERVWDDTPPQQQEGDEEEIEPQFLCAPFTILLDDCQHLFGPSERQQVLAMLNSGSRRVSRYTIGDEQYCIFRPMAFAGNARLPRSLAARCIPMVLRRKKPSDIVARFDPDVAEDEASEIQFWLEVIGMMASWHKELMSKGPPALPSDWVLTAHQEDCAEPLLQIADHIGGPWPERARAAIVACFSLAEYSPPIQVLADIRAWFRLKDDPEFILSRDLLPLLGAMEQRPWAGWNIKSGRRLANLLERFRISSRRVTNGPEKGHTAYFIKDFKDAWERYLHAIPGIELVDETQSEAVTPETPSNETSVPIGSA